MRVIALIADLQTIRRIQEHLRLWAPEQVERAPSFGPDALGLPARTLRAWKLADRTASGVVRQAAHQRILGKQSGQGVGQRLGIADGNEKAAKSIVNLFRTGCSSNQGLKQLHRKPQRLIVNTMPTACLTCSGK